MVNAKGSSVKRQVESGLESCLEIQVKILDVTFLEEQSRNISNPSRLMAWVGGVDKHNTQVNKQFRVCRCPGARAHDEVKGGVDWH